MSPNPLDGKFITLVALTSIAAVLAAYAVRVAAFGRVTSARLTGMRGTILLGRYPIEAFHWAAWGLGRALSRTRVTPDGLTFASLGVTALTAPLAAGGYFEAAGATLLLGSSFDALDGIVARERQETSAAGEVLDSVLDRYSDVLALGGVGIFYRESPWTLAVVITALTGGMMVSYVRAKTEKFRMDLPSTLMRRPERIAYLAGALLLGPLLSTWLVPGSSMHPVTLAVVLVMGIVTNVSALQLLVAARRELRRSAHRS